MRKYIINKVKLAIIFLATGIILSGCNNIMNKTIESQIIVAEYSSDNMFQLTVLSAINEEDSIVYTIQIPAKIEGNKLEFYQVINPSTMHIWQDVYYNVYASKGYGDEIYYYENFNYPTIVINTSVKELYKFEIYIAYSCENLQRVEDIIVIDYTDQENIMAEIIK